MTESEIKELKDRLKHTEMISEISCRMLENALEQIRHLSSMLAKAKNQYEELLRLQADKTFDADISARPQKTDNGIKYRQIYF